MPYCRTLKSLTAAATVAAALALQAAHVHAASVVMLDPFPPTRGWAMETDDSFTLMRAGCVEGLARIDFDQKMQPSLATSWEQSSPTSWDFSIRQGVKFHDGQDLNAAAVVNSLTHVLNAEVPSRAINPKVVSGVEAIDDDTVRISTPSPSVLLPYRLASANAGILSPAAYSDTGAINPVGTCTGPFVVTEILPKQLLRMVANENYWGGDVGIAEAEVHYVKDGNTRVTQLRSGEAQIATKIPLGARASLESDPAFVVHALEIPRTTAMYLNNKQEPFSNPLIRKAVQAAVDIRAIRCQCLRGHRHARNRPVCAVRTLGSGDRGRRLRSGTGKVPAGRGGHRAWRAITGIACLQLASRVAGRGPDHSTAVERGWHQCCCHHHRLGWIGTELHGRHVRHGHDVARSPARCR